VLIIVVVADGHGCQSFLIMYL